MKTKIKIIVADDQPIFRKAIIAFLNTFDHVEVIADVANGKELIHLLKKQLPDIVLLDLKMPIMDGWQAFDIIRQRFPETKVIAFSNSDSNNVVFDLLDKGINGFISKNDNPENIVKTITEVDLTGYYLNEARAKEKAEHSLTNKTKEIVFSEKETQIMKEVCSGSTNKMIANKFFISSSTVNFHKHNIYRKAKVKSAIELITFAARNRLLVFD